jgi:3'-phosphoadenosine 5'-phosphosulfate sulfotransferase (PAPS reductase)/FAD synthetase
MNENQLRGIFLAQRQGLPLNVKIEMTLRRIRQWYEFWDGQVYAAFSGGVDSTVMLFFIRALYPQVPAVFVDTGLEFPEVRAFVRTIENVIRLRPRHNFKSVCDVYGYPVVSKDVSMAIDRYRNTKSPVQKELRLHGGLNPNTNRLQSTGVIPAKYHYLLDAPFKISEKCCYYLKKKPLKDFEKKTGLKPFVGTMAGDSRPRKLSYIQHGCNSFEGLIQSRPLSFWTDEDIMAMKSMIPHSPIYQHYDCTGCSLCMFGVQEEMRKTGTNRFITMKHTHPNLHYALPAFGIDKVLNFMGVPHE